MNESLQTAFSKLGDEIKDFLESPKSGIKFHNDLEECIIQSYYENGWFTREYVLLALGGISSWLDQSTLADFLSNYSINNDPKKVGLIMAGNIPMVGFHDLMLVLLSENSPIVKLSSSDKQLMPCLINRLIEIEPKLASRVTYVERLTDFDAVIATGSNNSARYFEQYFKKKPNIIRRNRNSIAIINGSESEEELVEFGKDVFNYFGLGCRNVSKVLLPENYDLNKLFAAFIHYKHVSDNKKYINNYEYHKAIYMLNKANLLENGFFMMMEDKSLYSPVSMLFYQYYKSEKEIEEILEVESSNIQCVVSANAKINGSIPFGKSQTPAINDFADGVDSMAFLAEL